MTDIERRAIDDKWKAGVDEKLETGGKRFDELQAGQEVVIKRLDEQDVALKKINDTLDKHIVTTKRVSDNVQPLIEAIEFMRPGILVLGGIGTAVAWSGKQLRRIVVWMLPFGALLAAIWKWLHGEFK